MKNNIKNPQTLDEAIKKNNKQNQFLFDEIIIFLQNNNKTDHAIMLINNYLKIKKILE